MSAATYGYTEARNSLKVILDAAAKGGLSAVRRGEEVGAVVNGERLRSFLARGVPAQAQVVHEGGAWAVFIPGLPLATEAPQLDDALQDMISTLREYAEDWVERLADAPNHRDNWGLVQLIGLSNDEQLTEWLVHE